MSWKPPHFRPDDYSKEDQIFPTRDKFALVHGIMKAVSVKGRLRTVDVYKIVF